MTSPLIGITAGRIISDNLPPKISIPIAYMQAVARAGGLPVIIPTGLSKEDIAALPSRLDGLLLSGGGDISPDLFNGRPHYKVYDVDIDRDEMEISLAKLAADKAWPFLGICRGVQVLNVAFGGTLYTDIADQRLNAFKHDYHNEARDYAAHEVSIEPGSRLERVMGGTHFQVNSLHHQGIENLAPAFCPTGYASDGLVEGIELEGHPFGIGVQWHPEWLSESLPMQALFRAFIEAAGRS
jgi:putative glutamine amidotransferase